MFQREPGVAGLSHAKGRPGALGAFLCGTIGRIATVASIVLVSASEPMPNPPRLRHTDGDRAARRPCISWLSLWWTGMRQINVKFVIILALVVILGGGGIFALNRWQVSASELIIELAQKYPVRDVSVEEPEIEAIVREIYEHSHNGDCQETKK